MPEVGNGNVVRPGEASVEKPSGDTAIPSDAVIARRDSIRGLTAVGVPLVEAMKPFVAEAMVVMHESSLIASREIVAMSEFARTGVERMQVLFEMQKVIHDKPAFGQACMEAGFSPVGVALAGGFRASGPEDGKALIEAFGVDTWLAGCVVSVNSLYLRESDVDRVQAKGLIVPCGLTLFSSRPVEAPWLLEVGGVFGLTRTLGFLAPNLIRIGDSLAAEWALDIKAPALLEIGGELGAVKSKRLDFPVVQRVGRGLYAKHSQELNLPELKEVGHELNLTYAQEDERHDGGAGETVFRAPMLECIGGPLELDRWSKVELPSLRSVSGKPYRGEA